MNHLTRATVRALAAVLALTLCATACADGDSAADPPATSPGGEPPSDETTGATSVPTDVVADPATTKAGSDETDDAQRFWVGPLDAFLGFGGGDERSPEQIESDEAKSRQAEELIAACMQEQGFDYVVQDPSDRSSETGPWSLPADEFAHQYGYGISTVDATNDGQSDDPNQQIVDAMSVPERRAYYLALYGGLITVNDDGELEKPEAVDARGGESEIGESCSSQASEAVYGESTPSRDESGGADPFAALEQEMSALYDRVAADQRLVDATTAWAGCMADAGFPGYSELTDPVVDVDGRAGDVMGDQRDPSSADPTELQELRTFEIAVATADFECRIAYDDIDHLVRTELEQQFVDEHRAELEQFRDAMAAGEVGKG